MGVGVGVGPGQLRDLPPTFRGLHADHTVKHSTLRRWSCSASFHPGRRARHGGGHRGSDATAADRPRRPTDLLGVHSGADLVIEELQVDAEVDVTLPPEPARSHHELRDWGVRELGHLEAPRVHRAKPREEDGEGKTERPDGFNKWRASGGQVAGGRPRGGRSNKDNSVNI